jgi:hypothetical protein
MMQSTERMDGARKIPQGALTQEQLNQKRREYCKASAGEINRKQIGPGVAVRFRGQSSISVPRIRKPRSRATVIRT